MKSIPGDRDTFDNISYNHNGDILTSRSMGLKGGGYAYIDNLVYSYDGPWAADRYQLSGECLKIGEVH